MDNIARLNDNDRSDLFEKTAELMLIRPAAIEKDFWVCWVLDALFLSPTWRDKMIFKGGTSLSKAFHVIDRFSEDIDIVLDWRELGVGTDEPWDKRSNTGQDKFCKQLIARSVNYLANTLVPSFSKEIKNKLGTAIPVQADGETVKVTYPRAFPPDYLLPEIILEIGPLAQWVPHGQFDITPYAAEKFPDLFARKSTRVTTILAERSFWEKATILHKLACQGKIPPRSSRHYYDVAQLAMSDIKRSALGNLDLLRDVVVFKDRFYHSAKAQYEKAFPGSFRLIPDDSLKAELKEDYNRTKEMIFSSPPSFEEIIQTLKALETEINNLEQ